MRVSAASKEEEQPQVLDMVSAERADGHGTP